MVLVVREEVLYVVVEMIVILFKKLNKQFASVFTQASLDAKCKGITIRFVLAHSFKFNQKCGDIFEQVLKPDSQTPQF